MGLENEMMPNLYWFILLIILFIDIIHDGCNPLVYLVIWKQSTQNILIYNCNTALKHKNAKTRLATIGVIY